MVSMIELRKGSSFVKYQKEKILISFLYISSLNPSFIFIIILIYDHWSMVNQELIEQLKECYPQYFSISPNLTEKEIVNIIINLDHDDAKIRRKLEELAKKKVWILIFLIFCDHYLLFHFRNLKRIRIHPIH